MILYDDFLLLEDENGRRLCEPIMLQPLLPCFPDEFPPPETIHVTFTEDGEPLGIVPPIGDTVTDDLLCDRLRRFVRKQASELTDEQSMKSDHIARGAAYRPWKE